MFRLLLNALPTWLLMLIVVGSAVAIAAAGLLIVRRRWPHFIAGEHNDVAGILLGVVGATYGIMLAFVIVAVYEDFNDAEQNVRIEASQVSEIYWDTRGLDIADPMRERLAAYTHTVVEVEWDLMAAGELSDEGWQEIEAMLALLRSSEPKTQADALFLDAAIGEINELITARRSRLYDAQQELHPLLQAFVIGGALLVIGFTWLFGMKRLRTQLVMVGGVAVLIGFSLLIALLIDHPFSGDLSVSSLPFREGTLEIFWQR